MGRDRSDNICSTDPVDIDTDDEKRESVRDIRVWSIPSLLNSSNIFELCEIDVEPTPKETQVLESGISEEKSKSRDIQQESTKLL